MCGVQVETYNRAMAEAEDTAAGVFGDAAAEYAELRFVKNRLEQWKATQPASYRDCYVALSAPQLFAPYVRLETLGWAPLFSSAGLDSMNWWVLFRASCAWLKADLNPIQVHGLGARRASTHVEERSCAKGNPGWDAATSGTVTASRPQ